jgi:O-methyltransferase involved in polyketide biosynthesis
VIKIKADHLTGTQETLLIPLYIRALETKHPDPIIQDPLACEIVDHLEYDFLKLRIPEITAISTAMRVRQFDRWVKEFLVAHPNSIVVNIGCGLCTRFQRIDNGKVEWYDLDFPEVIELRKKLIAEEDRYHYIAQSVMDTDWIENLSKAKNSNMLFIAEGVLMYIHLEDVKKFVIRLQESFPGAELILDMCNRFIAKNSSRQPALKGIDTSIKWGVKGSLDIERWNKGIRLLEDWFYFNQKEKRLGCYNLFRYVPFISNFFRILHYKLG